MGKYRGLNITGGLKSNFKKIIVRKTVDEIEFTDRGEIIGTPSDLPTRGAGHRRNRNNFNRIGARGRTRGTVDYGVISGPESIVIQEHDYGSVSTWATTINDAAFETRRALGKAASIVDEENAVAPAATMPGSVSLYNSTGIIPAGTPLILNEDGTVSAVAGTPGGGGFDSTTYINIQNPNPVNFHDSSYGDNFGSGVGISSTHFVVGAHSSDAGSNATESGEIYIYDIETQTLQHRIVNPVTGGAATADNFGRSVDINDTYVIAGASGFNDFVGRAWIFNVSDGSLAYTLSNPNPGQWFGSTVRLSDSYAFVYSSLTSNAPGTVHQYSLADGSLVRTFSNPNSSNNDFFGHAIDATDNYLLIGAYGEAGGGYNRSGIAYLYDLSNGNLLHTINNPNAVGTTEYDYFGWAVAINNTHLAITATYEDSPAQMAGTVYIYEYDSNGVTLTHTIHNPNTINTSSGSDIFGNRCTINSTHVLVNALYERTSSGDSTAGAAYLIDLSSGQVTEEFENPTVYGTGNNDWFGDSMAMTDSHIIIGAWKEDGLNLPDTGTAYLYNSPDGTNLTADNYIGFSGSEFSYDGSLGQVITGGGVVTGLSGLVTGADYYVQNDGSISTTVTDVFAGTATSTTTLELPVPIIPISWGGDRAVTMGGSVPYRGTIVAHVDYFDITNPNNNATGFGSLAVEHEYGTNTAVSNKVRAVTAGGRNYNDSGNYVYIQDIQYITISLLGSAGDFGDLYSSGGRFNMMGVSDGTYGLFAGGTGASSSSYKGIHKITIATGGNSSSSNYLSTQRINGAGFSDGTYGFFAGGYVSGSGALRSIDYRVISTGGSVSNFGNLMAYSGSEEISACSNATYGVIFGGRQIGSSATGARGVIYSNAMEYVTMATQGDSTDFGTLPVGVNQSAAMSNPTTGVRAGGVYNGSNSNVIEYWQFDTPGSAQDFGNLVQSRQGHAGTAGDPS